MTRFRYSFIAVLAIFFLVLNLLFRLCLSFLFSENIPLSQTALLPLGLGVINDSMALFFVLLLPVILIFLPSDRFMQSRTGKIHCFVVLFVYVAVLVFNCFSEYFFWEEFQSRYNFIAVNYLIYTTEVIRNIIESYPIGRFLLLVLAMSLLFSVFLWKILARQRKKAMLSVQALPDLFRKSGLLSRVRVVAGYCLLVSATYFLFNPVAALKDRFWNEYEKNGLYELFSAYLHNELNYRQFYRKIDQNLAFDIIKRDLSAQTPNEEFLENTSRLVDRDDYGQKPNVVLVIIESLGSKKYVEHRPFLNSLAKESLVFTNMLSTGTRTVRGIEAIMLSIPPTPGNSIIRRKDNADLYSLATPFEERGYAMDFIYGGMGFFDNMNDFFEDNDFVVTDQLDYQHTTFENAWGQCDGDTYAESIRLADQRFSENSPFLQVIVTTSNHRPFTFPENTVDMPQGQRISAVRYTDYAIEAYISAARQKPWFEDTVFVFIGDHPSSIAGKTEIPHGEYGIVSMIYSPKYVAPKEIHTLCSQIDLAPTLLHLLNFDYISPFFGKDINSMVEEQGRAFVSTYDLLGFVNSDYLVVLTPKENYILTDLNEQTPQNSKKENCTVNRAISYYQTAYDLYTQKLLKEEFILRQRNTH